MNLRMIYFEPQVRGYDVLDAFVRRVVLRLNHSCCS